MKNVFLYETIIGKVGIAENGVGITDLFFYESYMPDASVIKETQIIKEAITQLMDYFTGKRRNFDLPLSPKGTEFQQLVWKALREIPYGETRSYKEVAESIGKPKAYRAVGMANNKNPIPIFIPCHRVIGADGKLVGYSGGIDIKIKLIDLEKNCTN